MAEIAERQVCSPELQRWERDRQTDFPEWQSIREPEETDRGGSVFGGLRRQRDWNGRWRVGLTS